MEWVDVKKEFPKENGKMVEVKTQLGNVYFGYALFWNNKFDGWMINDESKSKITHWKYIS